MEGMPRFPSLPTFAPSSSIDRSLPSLRRYLFLDAIVDPLHPLFGLLCASSCLDCRRGGVVNRYRLLWVVWGAGSEMGRLFCLQLEGKMYSCKFCQTHLALCEDIVSKAFHCRHGKAYLFNKVVNVSLGENEERMMMTGMHTVADIFCIQCGSIVGWKYESAHEKSQKYKEGKFILERFKVSGPDGTHYWVNHESHVVGSDGDDA